MNKSKIIKEISKMGYNEQLVVKALNTNQNNCVETVELLKDLKKRVSPNFDQSHDYSYDDEDYSTDSDDDPLDVLRDNSQFSQTREDILKMDSININMILKKDLMSKSSGRQLLENISLNQEMFLKLMTNTKIDNVGSMSCDLNLTDDDNLEIEKIKELGFPECEIVQAYFACDKDVNATMDLLNSK